VYFLYSVIMGLAVLLTSPYWLIQGLRHGKYLSNLGQRLGFSILGLEKLPAQHPGAIWIHAVSVGEALSGVALARHLKDSYPQCPLVVSTTTLTGYALAKERMPFADAVFYFPLDWAFSVRRVLNAVKPAVVIILETEIWPNFLREAGRRNIPVLFVSGRISDRSFARWQSYLAAFGFYLKPLLKSALDHAGGFLMQSQQDADRIRALGAPPERVTVSGNLKYDLELPAPTPLARWLEEECARNGRRPLIVAGSVVATEEPLALLVFGVVQGDFPKALLVLAPRKPERFAPAAEFIEESHRKFVRRSELSLSGPGVSPNASNGQNSIPDDVTVAAQREQNLVAVLGRGQDLDPAGQQDEHVRREITLEAHGRAARIIPGKSKVRQGISFILRKQIPESLTRSHPLRLRCHRRKMPYLAASG